MREFLTVRYLTLLSAALFVLCLPFDTFCLGANECADFPGWAALLLGWLGVMASSYDMSWLANPVLMAAWVCGLLGRRASMSLLGVVALAIGLSFVVGGKVMSNEGGVVNDVASYGLGYWLWIASMAVCCFALLMRPAISKR